MRHKWILPVLFCLCVLFVVWHMAGELWILRTWRNVLLYSAYWLALPFIVVIAGWRTKVNSEFLSSAVYLVLCCSAFAWFALTGSSDNGTADMAYIIDQYTHIGTFPIMELLLVILVYVVLYVANRVDGLVRRLVSARA